MSVCLSQHKPSGMGKVKSRYSLSVCHSMPCIHKDLTRNEKTPPVTGGVWLGEGDDAGSVAANAGYFIFDSSFGSVTRFRAPCAWSSLKIFALHHWSTDSAFTLITFGRTLQLTCKGEPFSL